MAAVDELSQLKRLLLGQEQQSLERLQERVERTGTRAQDVAEVLAESFELQSDDTERLSAAMQAPVEQCISTTVRDNPEGFADALFPVIGPAIRKAVSESISALSEKINRALERSFSIQGIKWRFESARTGVPISQIILRDTFIYRVEQAFVIQRESGLLISNVAREDANTQDSDAMSAMLTAIQDFVQDSFSSDDDSALDTIRVGAQVVWIFQGPEFITAALIAGQPPREMRGIFQEVTESIHREFGEAIKSFDGSESASSPLNSGVRRLLHPLLESEIQNPQHTKHAEKKLSPLVLIACLLALLFVIWLMSRFIEDSRLERLTEKIGETPGVELLSVSHGKPIVLKGLRDPLAVELTSLLEGTSLTTADINFEFIPFQSLESEIVVKRIASLFNPPDSIEMAVDDGILSISGHASPDYLSRLRGFPLTVFGINDIDTSNLNAPQVDIISLLRAELEAPETVRMRIDDSTIVLEGQAPFQWLLKAREHRTKLPSINHIEFSELSVQPSSIESYLKLSTDAPELVTLKLEDRVLFVEGGGSSLWHRKFLEAAEKIDFIDSVDSRSFVPIEVEELHALVAHINGQKFYFSYSDKLTRGSLAQLQRLKPDLNRIIELQELLPNVELEFSVRGFADSAGSLEQHEAVRVKRVARMTKYLLESSVLKDQITLISGQPEPADDESQQWRRAEINILIKKPSH